MMTEPTPDAVPNRRSETRNLVSQFYSVQFSINDSVLTYQFKLRDISPGGLGIIVKQDSDLLSHLTEGETVEVKFCPAGNPYELVNARTKIIHITKAEKGRYKGHCLVGLEILESDI